MLHSFGCLLIPTKLDKLVGLFTTKLQLEFMNFLQLIIMLITKSSYLVIKRHYSNHKDIHYSQFLIQYLNTIPVSKAIQILFRVWYFCLSFLHLFFILIAFNEVWLVYILILSISRKGLLIVMSFVITIRSNLSSQVSSEASTGPTMTIIHHSTRTQSPQKTHTNQVWLMSQKFVTCQTLYGIAKDVGHWCVISHYSKAWNTCC